MLDDDQIEGMLDECYDLPFGAEQLDAFSRVADTLESQGQLERVFELKLEMTSLADQAGLPERALEAFAWCRAKQREEPQRFTLDTLKAHERLIHSLIGDVPCAKLDALLDDFEAVSAAKGEGLYLVYWQREVTSWFRGDEAAADRYAALMREERLPPNECRVCDLSFDIRRIAERGDFELAVAMAQPILRGERTCNSQPAGTYQALLYPLLVLHQNDEAERLYQLGYRLFRKGRRHRADAGYYLRYLALVEAWDEGVALLERHLNVPEEFVLDSYAFTAYEGAWILCEKLRRAGHARLALPVAKRLGLEPSDDGGIETDRLSTWLLDHMKRIGAYYDKFNESDRFAKLLVRDAQLVETTFAPRGRHKRPRRPRPD